MKKNTKLVSKNRPSMKERMAASGNSNFFANAKKNNDEVRGWAFDFDKDQEPAGKAIPGAPKTVAEQ